MGQHELTHMEQMKTKIDNHLLGSTLPGFRSGNPPWLRLSQRPWNQKPLRKETKLISLAGWPPLPTLLYPAWP